MIALKYKLYISNIVYFARFSQKRIAEAKEKRTVNYRSLKTNGWHTFGAPRRAPYQSKLGTG
jgi:hypothetical protein